MTRIAVVIVGAIAVVLAVGQIGSGAENRNSFGAVQQTSGSPSSPPIRVAQEKEQASKPTYADVAKIIDKYHCTVCHGDVEPRAGLSLGSYKKIMKGAEDGPIVKAGSPDNSELIKRIKGISEPRMPLTGPPWLTDDEIGIISRWIAAGAPESKK